jgi:hypothetical protein
MSNSVIIEAHFLPSLEYFCALRGFNEIIIEGHERFVKQSYRSRCFIKTSQRVEMLSVPLTGKGKNKLFRDVRVDNSIKWSPRMWRTIMAAYRSSPFYEHYAPDLESHLSQQREFVYDFNLDLLSFCLRALRWEKKISETSEYNDQPGDAHDLRAQITDRQSASERNFYKPVPYYQVFGKRFEENLSLIDLLFCKGPEATALLDASSGNN